jgi:hypothetical protein
MKTIAVVVAAIVAVGAAAPASAQSQSDEWQFQIAPLYLWAVDLGGTMTVRGTEAPVEVDFADAFDKLEAAFTVHFEAWKGNWGILADFNWMDISNDVTLPGPIGATVGIDLQQTIAELAGGYQFDDHAFFIGGVRYISVDPKITLPLDNVIDPDESWVDGFVGLMWRPPLSKRWTFASRFDIGGGSSDLVVNALAAFDWAISRHVALTLGYRYLDYDYTDADIDFGYGITQHGPLAALRFFW